MEKVTVRKDELMEALQENRAKHEAIFLEAVEGYKAEAVRQLEEHIDRIRAGKLPEIFVRLAAPANHTREYDRAIRMLEMEVGDQVDIDAHSFGCYVMDDWDWKRQFLTSNSVYSATAAAAL